MTPKLPRVTSAEVIRALRHDGWYTVRQRGSHMIMRHPTKPGMVLVANHPGEPVPVGTLSSVLSQAGLTIEGFRALL